MRTVGITGGIASGKSTVAQIIREMGYPVFSADQIAREVVEPGEPAFNEVVACFGRDILRSDGFLDRSKLGGIVFADALKRQQLEAIIHPAVKKRISAAVALCRQKGEPLVFVEVPLLYESGMEDFFDAVWVVAVDATGQMERLMQRDGFSREEAAQRLMAQMPPAMKEQKANLIIENRSGVDSLKETVARCVKGYLENGQGI